MRRTESACPFCHGALFFADAPLPRLPEVRLGRAATFAFGAAVATSVAACSGGAPVPLYGAPAVDSGVVDSGGGETDAANSVDGAMLVDAADVDTGSIAGAYGLSPFDAGLDTGGSSSDYGAPPPP